jgi:hypothetical protein
MTMSGRRFFMAKRKSLAAAFAGSNLKQSEASTDSPQHNTASQDVNTASQHPAEPMISHAEVEMVPGGRGKMLPADTPVNLTFTVTAKERYLWNLELSRRGRTGVSVLREAMRKLLEDA